MTGTAKLQTESVEYNLTEHCNLKCAGCDHASPHLPEKLASLSDFVRDMEALAPVLQARELKFVGGEPLLHPQLLEFIREARRIKVAPRVVLITNGMLLHTMSEEIWGLVDFIWVSIYPGVKYQFEWPDIDAIARRHNVIVWRKETPTFFLTLVNQQLRNPAAIRGIYAACTKRVTCHTVYEGRFYKCAPAAFMQQRLALINVPFSNREADGVAIHGNPALHEQLAAYLAASDPLQSCSWCLGDSGPRRAHRQLSKRGRDAELAEDHRPIIGQLEALVPDPRPGGTS